MPTLGQRIEAAVNDLRAVSESPRTDAEYLLAHALGISRSRLLARLNTDEPALGFEELVARRRAYEPVPYIIGQWEFFSLELDVRAPMLVPRPETEHLVEAVLEHIGDRPARVLEVGTGTGCVAVAIAANAARARIVATDINPEAITLAASNCARHGMSNRVAFREGSLYGVLGPDDPPFDVVCSNPPYVEDWDYPNLSPSIRLYEDPRALVAGADGLDVIRRLVAGAPAWLVPGGLLALEMGAGQYATVRQLLLEAGLEPVGARRDLAGIERVACARKPAL